MSRAIDVVISEQLARDAVIPGLSRGQMEEIDRVYKTYPHLNGDKFVQQGLDEWLKP